MAQTTFQPRSGYTSEQPGSTSCVAQKPQRGLTSKPRVAKRTLGKRAPIAHEHKRGSTCWHVQPLRGWRGRFACAFPGCATRPRAMLYNPFGVGRTVLRDNPNGVQHNGMCNPFGVDVVIMHVDPGCAARPRALLLNPFGVGATALRMNPNGGFRRVCPQTPTGFNIKAQGRGAHPGKSGTGHA
jgi:hypothetical protein